MPNKENVLKSILDFLDLPIPNDLGLSQSSLARQADELSEEWVQRYREEKQKDWTNRW